MAERANPDDPAFQDENIHYKIFGVISRTKILKSPFRKALYWRYGWVSKFCKGRDVLDIPSGMGWGTSLIKGCKSLVGVDIDYDAIVEARTRYPDVAKFFVGDMRCLSFPSESFDVVICLEGIEHVKSDVGEAFLREACRILRINGSLFLSSPYCNTGKHSGNPFHVHEYHHLEITKLIEKKFNVVDIVVRVVDDLQVHYFHAKKIFSGND